MVELVLICAILNVALGYALAVSLRDPPLIGMESWPQWTGKLRQLRLPRILPGSPAAPSSNTEVMDDLPSPVLEVAQAVWHDMREAVEGLPPLAGADELPSAWRDMLQAEELVPRQFADGVAHALRMHLAAYRQHALAAEARARLVLSQENAEALEQLVGDFRFLHHEWLSRLLEGAELLQERHGRLGAAEDAGRRLESLLYDHAAHMESIDRTISEINFKTDVVLGCRRLLEELLDLNAAIHRLRDDLAESLAAILRRLELLSDLPHAQRLDPLTGRLNRLGLEAAFRAAAGPRQAVLIAWDSFHLFNERLGTRAGDRLLRTFSRLLPDLLDASSAAAEIVQLTGTRFLLFLDGISRDQATTLAEQLRQSLEGVTLDCQGTSLDVTARIGITTVEPDDKLPLLLERLTAALNAAELAGRNRCAIAEGSEARIVAPHNVPVVARRVEVDDTLVSQA